MQMNIKYPKDEIVWVGYYNKDDKPVCFLTSKPSRDFYFLYEVNEDGVLKKLGKAKEPPELIDKFKVFERMAKNGVL